MSLRIVGIFAGLLSLVPIARADDRRIQAQPSAVQSVITVMLKRPGKAEIELKNGTKLSGKLIRAGMSGLVVEEKGGTTGVLQVLPYDQLSMVRLDLGPNRGWQRAGVVLGFTAGFALLLASVQADSRELEKAGSIIMIAGPIAGAILLGNRHRDWLIVEVL